MVDELLEWVVDFEVQFECVCVEVCCVEQEFFELEVVQVEVVKCVEEIGDVVECVWMDLVLLQLFGMLCVLLMWIVIE